MTARQSATTLSLLLVLFTAAFVAHAAPEPQGAAKPAAGETLRYGVVLGNAPIETYDAKRGHEGLAAVTLALAAEPLKLRVEIQTFPNDREALEAVRGGRIDCFTLRLLEGTTLPELALSTPFLRSPLALMVRAGAADVAAVPERVGVPQRDDLRAFAEKELAGSKRVDFATTQEAVTMLAGGRVDAVLGDPIAMSYEAARLEKPLTLKVQRQFAPTIAAVFAFAGDKSALRDRVQGALNGITRERADQLRHDWLARLGLAQGDSGAADDTALPPQGEGLKELLAQLDKDTSMASSARDALKAATDRLLRREQDSESLKSELAGLEALEAQAERESALVNQGAGAGDRELAFLSWKAELGGDPTPGELWSQAANVREQVDALRARPTSNLNQGASTGAKPAAAGTGTNPPFDLGRFALELPNVAGYSARLVDAARLIERRRAALEARIGVARRRSLQVRAGLIEIERHRHDEALALSMRKLEYVESELGRALGTRIEPLRQAAKRVLAEPGVEGTRKADAEALLALSVEGDAVARRLLEVTREQDVHTTRLQRTQRALENTRERLNVASQSTALGLVLVSELEHSLPPEQVKANLDKMQRELANVRLRLVALREEPRIAGVGALTTTNAELLQAFGGETPPSDEELATARARLGTAVETGNVALADTLIGIESVLLETERANNELQNLIRQRLLWTPSHAPIGPDWFAQLPAQWQARKGYERAREDFASALGWMSAHPVAAVAAALFAVLLLGLRPLLWRLIEERRAELRSTRTDRIGHTLVALGCTLVLALHWGIGLELTFLALGGGWDASGTFQVLFGQSHGEFWVGFALGTMFYLADPRGVGTHHFDWSLARRERTRRTTLLIVFLLVPGYEFLAAGWYRGNLGAVEYGGRALMILSWLALALVGWRTFAPGGLWFRDDERGAPPQWSRRVLRLVAAGSAISVSVYATLGYELTAAAIARSLTYSVAVLPLLSVSHALALRWIAIGEKRASVDAVLSRREAKREGVDAVLAQAEREGEQIAQVSAQSRRLVDFLVMVAAVVLFVLVWSELLPAIRRLDEIALWQVNIEREGKALLETVSVLDLMAALAAAFLTVVALRTVPSTLDLVLRQRKDSDPGTRFAFAALTRYFIVLVGVMSTFGLLGVRWGHLQWLAAALTVGLGFGLQEIFANFVSGLIVLFERRVRVGDVITVGTVTGTVTTISTRASTLLDFDRREVMVPNKTLITEQLTNWTLTDAVTRLVIKVAVAYGSEPGRVHQLLQQAAHEESRVLEQPEPQSFFMALGQSAMEFELRVFVQRVDERPEIMSALYHRIVTLLGEAGITVPFPQMDLWVRSTGAAGASADATTEGSVAKGSGTDP